MQRGGVCVSSDAMSNTQSDAPLNDSEAAAYLQVKPRTLREWRATRGLPFIKLTAREIRYRRSDLDRWMDRHRVVVAA